MAVFIFSEKKRFLAFLSVVLIGICIPFFGTQASDLSCKSVHVRSQIATSPQKWLKIPTLDGKVDHIVKTFTTGAKDFYQARDFAAAILSLPKNKQRDWFIAIGKAYRQVPKKDPNPLAGWHIGGRRVLDRILTLLENYQDRFQVEIHKNGIEPDQAYQHFLNRQSEMFGTQYGSKEVEIVISVLQEKIRSLEKFTGRANLHILISGSFPNGKADLLVSDIDLSVSDGGMVKLMYDLQARIDRAFSKADVASNLEVAISMEPIQFYGKINPIIIQVFANQVQLLVFPPAIPRQGYEELIAGDPQVYQMKLD